MWFCYGVINNCCYDCLFIVLIPCFYGVRISYTTDLSCDLVISVGPFALVIRP